jgi:hypothetical protein
VQEEQQQRGHTDQAPGRQDAVDPALVIARSGIEVIEDDGEDQQRPAKQPCQPLIAEVDQTLGGILRTLPPLARGIAGGGHRRNYPVRL